MWNNESEINFLEIYQTEPILWESTHRSHKDKRQLLDAWVRISEETDFAVPDLKKKKDSLMVTYRGHLRKIKKSIPSGAGSGEVYKPIWFAFDLINSFLDHLYECKKTNTEIQGEHLSEETVEGDMKMSQSMLPNKRKRTTNMTDPSYDSSYRDYDPPPIRKCDISEHEAVGINIAKKLQRMDPIQAIYAEYIINKVLRRGLLKTLQTQTNLCDDECGKR